jgi:hypothetical protein
VAVLAGGDQQHQRSRGGAEQGIFALRLRGVVVVPAWPGPGLDGGSVWLAGDWPVVDWQTGLCALEVAAEHDGQRPLRVVIPPGGGELGRGLAWCTGRGG